VTDHGLVCLDGEDYAAVAMAMEADARAVDASVDSIADSLAVYGRRPFFTAITTVGNGPLASNGETQQSFGSWGLVAANFSSSLLTFNPLTPITGSLALMTLPVTGWWDFGGYGLLQAAGAVTAFSRRTVVASAWTMSTLGGVPVLYESIHWRTGDTNTGGEYLTTSGGTFYGRAGSLILLSFSWSHANLASNVSSPAGARFWCHYIGTGVDIGSA
jgi:hypothetical protein